MKNSCRAAMPVISVILLCLTVTQPMNGEVVSNEIISYDETVNIPCANGGAGEDVRLTGQTEVKIWTTENEDQFHYKTQSRPQGIYGLGSVTGDVYHAVGLTQTEYSYQIPRGQQYQQTYVNNYRVIGQGPGNNFLFHEVFHVTYNGNGETTVVFDKVSTECK